MNTIKSWIVEKFNALPDKTKVFLISAFNTFSSTFISVIGATLAAGDIKWTYAFWGGLLVAGVRAGWKAVADQFVPVRLGGKK